MIIMNIQVIRATETWQRAGAYYVRIQGMARQHNITLRREFDEHDGPDTRYIVLTDNDFPVATCRFYRLDTSSAMIGRVVVLPEYRGNGLGRRVMSEAENWLRELGYARAVIESRDVAVDFYRRLGYSVTDPEIVRGETFDCIRMEKELTVPADSSSLKVIFESERISFAEVSELLTKDYLVMVNDIDHVERFLGGRHDPYTNEQEVSWVRKKLEEKAPVFSMIEKNSGQFIGNIELMRVSDSVSELGIAVTAEKQDKGYGTEAVSALTAYGMEHLGLEKIILRTRTDNARAIRVYEKCGFREYNRTGDHIFMEKSR